MKKILLLVTTPLLLIDACSSVRLSHQETTSAKITEVTDATFQEKFIGRSPGTAKQVVIRELSNGEFDLSRPFVPTIKDHYRKEILHVKINPEE
jgi:hypothetical protein